MNRFDDWPELLSAYLIERAQMSLEWGVHDCCAFAAGAAHVQCGVDPMKAIYGRYKTAKGAAGFISRNGGDLKAVVDNQAEKFGFPEISPLRAGRGCIVLADVPIGNGTAPALGVVGLDSRKALFVPDVVGSWYEIPVIECKHAWGFD